MTKKKAVIFDMDGVIVDSERLWKQAEKEIFSSLGVDVTDEFSELTKSMTTTEVTRFWYDKYPWSGTELHIAEQRVISRVISLIETEECRIPGVKAFIELIRAKNYKTGLATNSPDRILSTVLQKFDIAHLFDTVSSAEFEEKGKPDPSIYLSTAKKLNIEPENCLVIEDSYSGMLAARNAGMSVIAFTNGDKETRSDIADYKIDSFESPDFDFLN